MRFFHACFAGLLAIAPLCAQPAPLPLLPAAIRQALPAGYAVLAAESGDLNRDATPDWVVVLNKPDEKRTSDVSAHPTKRPLLLFVGNAGGRYTLAARSDNAVYCVDCGGMMGDPFQGITIKNGYFTMDHYGGSAQRWTRLVTFRYDPAARTWLLHRDGGEQFSAFDPEHGTSSGTTARNFGRVLFTRFDIYHQ